MKRISKLRQNGISSQLHIARVLVMGLGGTMKRLASKASLQRPYNNQILQ